MHITNVTKRLVTNEILVGYHNYSKGKKSI